MSQRHQLERHKHRLGEARQIMSAMQSLAFMESRKLRGFVEIQQQVVKGIDRCAADLLAFFPGMQPAPPERRLLLVVGSERGFCGNFNESLIQRLERTLSPIYEGFVACGHKLCTRLEDHRQLIGAVAGAALMEEVEGVLKRLTAVLADQGKGPHALALEVIYQDPDAQEPVTRTLLPPFRNPPVAAPRSGHAPEILLPPEQLLAELTHHSLFATLHEILYRSMMAENQRRTKHLDGAVRHLDQSLERLAYRDNQLRQEEIIEEIEVILLNADATDLSQKEE
ncbi:F0F1 ATP synthase subunit gamma [Microbulbifer guangxiensis]|uniref:F0F1 ATP synthase subunit gamma n=1 Tax=Microbulbifer guangxiensis TaxID=2904249 RepID=UPI001F02F366|nr:FoF1 ATP synthase subunit gamma [Microbulbifer guangxiensis]